MHLFLISFILLFASCSHDIEYVYVLADEFSAYSYGEHELTIEGLASGNSYSVDFYQYSGASADIDLLSEVIPELIAGSTPVGSSEFTAGTASVILPIPAISGYANPNFIVKITEYFNDSAKVYFKLVPVSMSSSVTLYSDSFSDLEDNTGDADDTPDSAVVTPASIDIPYYGISLSVPSVYEFPTRQVGYIDQNILEVSVTNNGMHPTGKIHIQLTVPDDGIASPFLLSASSLASLDYNQTDVFKIAVNAGLSVGIYSGIVTVIGDNDLNLYNSFRMTFRVSAAPVATVAFDLDGGNFKDNSIQLTQYVVAGEALSEPSPPTKYGHSFIGWQLVIDDNIAGLIDSTDTIIFYNFSQPVYISFSLFAVFIPNVYPVYFFPEGGTEVEFPVVHAPHGTLLPAVSTTRPGYRFLGWFTAAEGGEEWQFNRAVFSDLALYAHWQRTPYLVQFANCSGISSVTAYYGSKITKPENPLKDNLLFDYWYILIGSEEYRWDFASDVVTEPTILWAAYSSSYYVIFDADNSSASNFNVMRVPRGTAISAPAAPVKGGLTFNGWHPATNIDSEIIDLIGISNPNAWLKPKSEEEALAAFDFRKAIDGNLVLKAQWIANVIFDSMGGSYVPSVVVREGMALAAPLPPTREGFIFNGWYTLTGTMYPFTAAIYSDLKLYAQWVVEVTFMSEGYDPELAGTIAEKDIPGTYGVVSKTNVAENGVLYSAYPMRNGYDFVNWYTGPDNTGLLFDFTIPITAQVTLYARWTAKTFTITGDYSINHPTNTQEKVTYNITYDSSSNAATIAAFQAIMNRPMAQGGYAFMGWFTESTHLNKFTMASTQYFDIINDFTLYAWWLPVYEVKINARNIGGPAGTNGHIIQTFYIREGAILDPAFIDWDSMKYPTVWSAVKGFYVDRGDQKWRFYVDRVFRNMELYARYVYSDSLYKLDDWYY